MAAYDGLYTNVLVTQDRIYLPQLGISEHAIATEQGRAVISREIVLVSPGYWCSLGGGEPCMSWQLRCANAELLRRRLAKSGR